MAAASTGRPSVWASKQPPHGLGPESSVDVALTCGHDRALHEDVPLAGEGLGSGTPASRGQVREEGPDVGQLLAAGLVDRVLPILDLEQGVDEEATLEAAPAEPAVEHVEDGQQALGRVARRGA